MQFLTCLIIILGGALGTFARYAISLLALPIGRGLPWGTIIINMTGSLAIGFIGTLTLSDGRYPISENARLFLMVGFCGGYTTFSAFSLQTLDLLRSGAAGRALLNVVLSVALCVAAGAFGHALAAQLNDGANKIAQLQIEEDG